jgi:hypothetical protein
LVARSQPKQQQATERERRREITAQAVGTVLSIMVGAQLARAGPGPDQLSAYWNEWEQAWSAARERLLVMTVGHQSARVNDLGLEVARLIPEWLKALRHYQMAAQELSQVRPVQVDDEPALADSKAEVVARWEEANSQVHELLKAVREKQ